jgi:pyrroloquinoline quinone biosynthesis protein B
MPTDRRSFLALLGAALAAAKALGQAEAVEVEILGAAQDGGLPHLGCPEERCRRALADPQLRKRVACLGVRAGASLFLVDATPDIVTQIPDLQRGAERPRRRPVDGILLTHAHIGHYLGLAQLGREALGAEEVPVHATARMVDYLKKNGPWSLLVTAGHVRPVPLEPGKPFELAAGLSAEAISVPHREEFSDTVGYLFRGPQRRLLYIPDIDRWEPLSPPLEVLARRADYLLLDGSFWDPALELAARDPKLVPHPPVPETMARLGSLGGERRVVFIHLNHTNPLWDRDSLERKQVERAGMKVGEEGDRFPL